MRLVNQDALIIRTTVLVSIRISPTARVSIRIITRATDRVRNTCIIVLTCIIIIR